MTTTCTIPEPHPVAASEFIDLGRRLAVRTRAEQGLPAQVEDAEVLDVFTDLAALPLGRSSTQD